MISPILIVPCASAADTASADITKPTRPITNLRIGLLRSLSGSEWHGHPPRARVDAAPGPGRDHVTMTRLRRSTCAGLRMSLLPESYTREGPLLHAGGPQSAGH